MDAVLDSLAERARARHPRAGLPAHLSAFAFAFAPRVRLHTIVAGLARGAFSETLLRTCTAGRRARYSPRRHARRRPWHREHISLLTALSQTTRTKLTRVRTTARYTVPRERRAHPTRAHAQRRARGSIIVWCADKRRGVSCVCQCLCGARGVSVSSRQCLCVKIKPPSSSMEMVEEETHIRHGTRSSQTTQGTLSTLTLIGGGVARVFTSRRRRR